MNKKANTIIFILGATVFNVLVAIISFVLLILLYVNFFITLIPENAVPWYFFGIFIASLAISFVVYRYALKFILTKIDVDKYFDPLFVRRNLKKPGA
jgi:phosphoglycerol transferase MdoB-like AlkP superfamily enzyme